MNRRSFLGFLSCLALAPKLVRMEPERPYDEDCKLSMLPTARLTQSMLDEVYQDLIKLGSSDSPEGGPFIFYVT